MSLPPNVHLSTHPCLQAKLSLLRSSSANARDTKALIHEISLIVGCEATATGLSTKKGPTVSSLLNHPPPKPYADQTTAQNRPGLRLHYNHHHTHKHLPRTHIAIRLKHARRYAPSTPQLSNKTHLTNVPPPNTSPPNHPPAPRPRSPPRPLPRSHDPLPRRILQQPPLPPARHRFALEQRQQQRLGARHPAGSCNRHRRDMCSCHTDPKGMGRQQGDCGGCSCGVAGCAEGCGGVGGGGGDLDCGVG